MPIVGYIIHTGYMDTLAVSILFYPVIFVFFIPIVGYIIHTGYIDTLAISILYFFIRIVLLP